MQGDLRRSGIPALPDLNWGAHLCVFYDSARDLLDLLTQYIKAGLENNEFCLMVTAAHLQPEEVERELGLAIPHFERYVAQRAFEIVTPETSYLDRGAFQRERALRYWADKAQDALARGFDGMRVNGDEWWLEPKEWSAFGEYEIALDDAVAGTRMIVLCAYPLAHRTAAEVLDVARGHQFVIAKRDGAWDILETAALKQTKWELQARVSDAHAQLTLEQAERTQLERELTEKERLYRNIFETTHDVMIFQDSSHRIVHINHRGAAVTGYSLDELGQMNALRDLVFPPDAERVSRILERVLRGDAEEYESRWRSKYGEIIHFHVISIPVLLSGQTPGTFCSLRNITRREEMERALQRATDELQALSRKLVDTQETERRELSRELHDRIGQNLTALGINLDVIKARHRAGDHEIATRLDDSIALVAATADATVNLLTELRPPMLDDLGLVAALEWFARAFSERTGIDVAVTAEEGLPRFAPRSEIALFRIAQEALNNVAKHADARRVDIEVTREDSAWVMSVSDDGRGVDVRDGTQPVSGFGITMMRERALAVGGRFEVLPRLLGGTSVVVRVPVP